VDFSLIGADDPTGPSPPPSRIALLILVHDARGVCFLEGWRIRWSSGELVSGRGILGSGGEGGTVDLMKEDPLSWGGESSKDDADVIIEVSTVILDDSHQ
jgi:hypothetical protein